MPDVDGGPGALAVSQGRAQMNDMFRSQRKGWTGPWRYSREMAVNDVSKILRWRAEALQGKSCPILPLELQKVLQRRDLDDWVNDPSNAEVLRDSAAEHTGAALRREIDRLHFEFWYRRCGGRHWIHLLIAFGTLDDDILDAVNGVSNRRHIPDSDL